jgi:hypothetical protein
MLTAAGTSTVRKGVPGLPARSPSSAAARGTGEEFTAAEIRRLMEIMARIVATRNGKFLEIFELLEAELALAEKRESALARVFALAKSVQQTDNKPSN